MGLQVEFARLAATNDLGREGKDWTSGQSGGAWMLRWIVLSRSYFVGQELCFDINTGVGTNKVTRAESISTIIEAAQS